MKRRALSSGDKSRQPSRLTAVSLGDVRRALSAAQDKANEGVRYYAEANSKLGQAATLFALAFKGSDSPDVREAEGALAAAMTRVEDVAAAVRQAVAGLSAYAATV